MLVSPGAGVVLRPAAATASTPTSTAPTDRDAVGPAPPAQRGAQADELLVLGPDVYVEQPASLRDEVVSRLRAAAAVTA